MTKLFKLKMVRNFRQTRPKACGNFKYLSMEDHGMTLRCRPNRIQRGDRPHWRHHSGNFPEDVFADVWTHVCDRWSRKP